MDIKTSLTKHERELVGIRSMETVKAYRTGLKKFIEFLNTENKIQTTHPVESLTADIFIEFPSWLGEQGYPKSTVSNYISGTKSFMDFLVIKNILKVEYSEGLRWKSVVNRITRKRESKLPRFPKPEDVPNMIKAVRQMKEESPRLERNIALVYFLSSTGCRNDEAKKLKLKDVNLRDRSALVVGKGSKERRVFFSPEALEEINKYLKVRGFGMDNNHPLFCRHDKGAGNKVKGVTTTTIRNVVKDVSNIAGVKPFSPHYFRHAFAIKILRETGNLALVQDLLGHEDPKATRRYAKIYQEDLQKDYRKVYG